MTAELLRPKARPPRHRMRPVTISAPRRVRQRRSHVLRYPIGVARESTIPSEPGTAPTELCRMVAGRPLGIVALVENDAPSAATPLATLPEDRRLGYGEALLRSAVEQARQDMRVRRVVLQSSDAGHSLYRRMGFEKRQVLRLLTK